MSASVQFGNSTFTHNGSRYTVDVRFVYKNGNEERNVVLGTSNILDVEINTVLNRLFTNGFVIYRDINGDVGRMIGIFNNVCMVTMYSYESQINGGVITWIPSQTQKFSHSFIVDNITIVDNDAESITYCIYLTGSEYFKMLNHVSYSDYGNEQKKTVMQIIGEMLTKYGKVEIDDSFTKITSDVKMNYISNGMDTVMTSIDYLMQKQFFIADNTEKTMKFLIYDFIDNKYKAFQIGQTPITQFSGTTLSFNNTSISELMQQDAIKLGSISDNRKSDINHNISQITIRNYDINSNTFGYKTYSSQQIVNFMAGQSNKNVKMTNVDPTENSFITRDVSDWDNDINVYNDMVDVFMNYDSVLINIGGAIGRRLMDCFNIAIDSRPDTIPSDKTTEYDDYMSRYKQLQGGWYITKIRYIIKPNESIFHQNLQLSRVGTNR